MDMGWQVPGIRLLLGSASSLLVSCLPLRQVGCLLQVPTASSASSIRTPHALYYSLLFTRLPPTRQEL